MALSARDRRTVTIGGIVVGALLLGFVLFSVLGGGDEGLPPTGPPLSPPTSSPTPSPGEGPPIQNFTGRDPFSVPPALSPSPSPTTTGSPTGSPSGGPSGSPSGSPSVGPSGSPSPTAPGGGSSQNVGGSTVVLLDIFRVVEATRVQVEVDGTVFNVGIGERFAGGRFE